VEKPVGRIDPLTIGMASQAHAGLPALIKNGLDSNYLSLPDVHLEIAGPSAMAVAHSMDNSVLAVGLFFAHYILRPFLRLMLVDKNSLFWGWRIDDFALCVNGK
jgi:hypothetical protein